MASSSIATSPTVRAIGPATPKGNHGSASGQVGTRPGVGRRPTTLQKLAGLRSEPPRSLPSASGTMPVASATAEPPLLPPHVLVRSNGLRVAPKTSLKVCDPAPNSGVFVLPMVIAPARRSRSTIRAVSVGTWFANTREPKVVRRPAVTNKSLCATGRPWSGPTSSPRVSAASAASASISAVSDARVTTALTTGLTWSTRARCAVITSRQETRRVRISSASARAVHSHRSAGCSSVADTGAFYRGGARRLRRAACVTVRTLGSRACVPGRTLGSDGCVKR